MQFARVTKSSMFFSVWVSLAGCGGDEPLPGGAAGTGVVMPTGTAAVSGAPVAGTAAVAGAMAVTGAGTGAAMPAAGTGAAGTGAAGGGSVAAGTGAAGTGAAGGGSVVAGTGAAGTGAAGMAAAGTGAAGMGAPAFTPGSPTFSAIYQEIIVGTGCNGGPTCHASTAAGQLKMVNKADAYTALVGVKAMGMNLTMDSGPNCKDSGLTRVVANDPMSSLLYKKLATMAMPECGNRMPPAGNMLPADRVEQVRMWIMKGAPND